MSFELKDGDLYVTDYAGATNGTTVAQAERHLRNQVAETLKSEINDFLIEEYEGFELVNGSIPDSADEGAIWDSKLDDLVFEAFQGDVARLIGVDLIGSFANDMRLWEPDSRLDMASKLAKAISGEIEITLPKSDAAPVEKPKSQLGRIDIARVMTWVREANPGLDDLELYDMLADCGDSDAILAGSAATHTLTSNPDILVLAVRQAQAEHGAEWIDVMLGSTLGATATAVAEAANEIATEEDDGSDLMAPTTPTPAEKPARRNRTAKVVAEANANSAALSTAVAKLSDLSGHTDVALAEKLGLSRSHFLKVKSGKAAQEWTPDQVATIGALIEEHREAANQLSNDFGALV